MGEHTQTYVQGLALLVALVSSVLTVFADRGADHKLSTKGKVTLASAIVAGVLAFWLLSIQAASDRKKALDQAQTAAQQSKTNEALLKNIQRQLYPIMPQQPITISSTWKIRLSEPGMKPWATRVMQLIDPLVKREMTVDEWCGLHKSGAKPLKDCEGRFNYTTIVGEPGQQQGPLAMVFFSRDSELYPTKQEADVREVLESFGTRVCLTRGDLRDVCNENSELAIEAVAGRGTEFMLDLTSDSPGLEISATNMPIGDDVASTGSIVSVADLSGANMEVQYHERVDQTDGSIRLSNAMRPSVVTLNIQGRKYFIGYRQTPQANAPFTCRLQNEMENSKENVECRKL